MVMDAKFKVDLEPLQAREYLSKKENWLHIIPGVSTGTIQVFDKVKDWSLQAPNGGLTYSFSNISSSNENDEAVSYSYKVGVTGKTSGLPVSFNFLVKYNFIREEDGCGVQRTVTDLSVNACSCISCMILSSLKSGLLKENTNMKNNMCSIKQKMNGGTTTYQKALKVLNTELLQNRV